MLNVPLRRVFTNDILCGLYTILQTGISTVRGWGTDAVTGKREDGEVKCVAFKILQMVGILGALVFKPPAYYRANRKLSSVP